MNERVKKLLRVLKEEKGVNQRKLAEIIGVTEGAVSGWVSGRRNITEQSIKAICREFAVNEEWLRSGKGDMFLVNDEDEFMKAAALLSTDSFAKKAIIEYFKLDSDSQRLLRDFVSKLSDAAKGRE